MAYYETDIPMVTNGNNGSSWGNDAWWIVILLIFGWGRNGFGGGFGGGNEQMSYDLGKLATTNDVASGFSTSTIIGGINDLKLGQQSGFADIQSTLCQGFSGVNTAILNTNNQLGQAVCNLGYNIANQFNTTNQAIANCCCEQKQIALENRYLNERQTCDLITNQNANTQRIVDLINANKIEELNRKLTIAETSLNQCQNNAYLIGKLQPCPQPAYVVPNPNCCYTSCGNSIQ